MIQKIPEGRLQFPTLMELNSSNCSDIPRLHSFENNTLVIGFSFDSDVFASCEVALEVDDFEILNI